MAQYGTRIKRHCGRMELSSLQIEMTRGPQTKTNMHQSIFKPSSKNHRKPSSVHTLVLCFHMFPKTPRNESSDGDPKLHRCNPRWLGARLSHPAPRRPGEAAPGPAPPSNETSAIPVKQIMQQCIYIYN